MMRGMYAAISGLSVHQTMLDVTANNLANVDTIGYKAQRTTFTDELSQQLRSAAGPGTASGNGGNNAVQVGLGVQLGSVDNLMGEGSMQSTGNTLDIAIQGDGFFQVGSGGSPHPAAGNPTPPTTIDYTRAGNFTLNSDGDLMTQSGQYVMGQSTQGNLPSQSALTYINIPPGSTNLAVSQWGEITFTPPAGYTGPTQYYLSVASFPNEAGLLRQGGSLWGQSPSSGAPTTIGSPTPGTNNLGNTISGELEQSNVDLATEFTNMITAERGYQANSRVISTADQMLQTLVTMGQ